MMMIIVKGIAEIYTTFEEDEFKIEYLKQGDILNHTLFLYEKPAFLPIKCIVDCDVLVLSTERVSIMRESKVDSSLNKECTKIVNYG